MDAGNKLEAVLRTRSRLHSGITARCYDIPRHPSELMDLPNREREMSERLSSRLLKWQRTLPPGLWSPRRVAMITAGVASRNEAELCES